MTRMKGLIRLLALAGVSATVLPGAGHARIIEEVVEVPVQVMDAKGRVVNHVIRTSVYHDDARTKSPFLILTHGRAVEEPVRRQLRLDPYVPNIRYFVDRGFAVLAPLRVSFYVSLYCLWRNVECSPPSGGLAAICCVI